MTGFGLQPFGVSLFGQGVTDLPTLVATEPGAPYLAVDVLPDNVPGTFALDQSELDGEDLLGWGMDGWLNVVCDVQSVEVTRGATRLQGPLTRTEAGTCSVRLSDTDRRFDPTLNADAVRPGTPVRLRAWNDGADGLDPWDAVLFTGRIGADSLTVQYLQEEPPAVTFTAVDAVGTLAQYVSLGRPDPGAGAGDNLLGRVGRVLTETGSSIAVAVDSDAAYVATMPASALARGWVDVTAAADAELGRVWVSAANALVVRARGSALSGPVRGTLSDLHGEQVAGSPHCCYREPVVRMGTEMLANRGIGSRRVPGLSGGGTPPVSAVVQVDDTYSQARWSAGVPVTYEERALELETDEQIRPWAEWLVLNASEPELRVDRVTPAPGETDAEAWRALCLTDVGDRWYYRLRPQVGPVVAFTLGVLGLVHRITPAGWETTWYTETAPTPGDENPSGWFVLDLSYLDGGDVLAPFGGAVPA